MTYADKTVEEVRAAMNERYADRSAYADTLPWDLDRHALLVEAVVKRCSYGDNIHSRRVGDVLDVGCAGGGMVDLFPCAGMTSYTGLDISDEAMRLAAAAHPNGKYVACAIENVAYTEAFDTVIAIESIEHWVDVHAGLEGVRRALRPGGRFVLTTPNRDSLHVRIGHRLGREVPFCSMDHVKEYGFDEIRDIVSNHGFRWIDAEGVGLMPYWTLERDFGNRIRQLTDSDPDVFCLLNRLGKTIPEVAFIQIHSFESIWRMAPCSVQDL